jgi:hypothetical protein
VCLFGSEKDGALAVGRDAVDLTGFACGYEQLALGIEGHAPDVFRFGVVEELWLPGGCDAINFGVGRGGGVNLVFAIHRDGMNLHGRQLRQSPRFSV